MGASSSVLLELYTCVWFDASSSTINFGFSHAQISCSLLIVSWSAYFHEVVKLLPLLIALMYSEQAVSDQDATDVSNDNPEARQAVAMAGIPFAFNQCVNREVFFEH